MSNCELVLGISAGNPGISKESISALEECRHEIARRANSVYHPLTLISGLSGSLLHELVGYLGKSSTARLYRDMSEEDPQRELLVRAVTDLINPNIEEDKIEEALEGTRKALGGTLVL